MEDVIATMDDPLTVPQAVRLDRVCDCFEAAWKRAGAGEPRPRLEEYLADAREPERSLLLHQLLLLEIDYRRLRGESPAAEEYGSRFPGLSSEFLVEAFPPPPPVDELATVAPPPFSPQLRSARYVVRQFHARGGIGEIWLAEDAEIGRQVALKRLRRRLEEQQDRFLIEAQITGQLEHPGIVPVHDLGVDEEGRAFYVMTFIHGRTLKEVIDEYHAGRSTGAPPPPQPRAPEAGARGARREPPEVQRCRLLEIFVKVCETVAYAHNRGVIHRDLKPDNVMIGPYGETLVLDWGMAKVLSLPEQPGSNPPVHLTYTSGSTKTQAGHIMGSPFYMAPEMADGRAVEADDRTDVYLLGATLYHILTGHAPREGRSLEEVIELARQVPPPPPRKLKAEVPRALNAICLKAMAHAKQDRYASALELAVDVKRYLADAPVAAYPEPVWVRAWRWCKRHRRAVAAAVLGVTLLGAVLGREALEREALRGAAREREETLRREAANLRLRDKIRGNLAEFQDLADEMQFYTEGTIPGTDRPLPVDASRGRKAGDKALALAEELTEDLKRLPLPDEQTRFDKQLYELLLLMVQTQSQQFPSPKIVQVMLQQLERAAPLQKPSRGYHRLRARCFQLLGDTKQRDEETRRADDPRLAATALDYFLQAEQARSEAASPATGLWDATIPNPERLNTAIQHYEAALSIEPDHYWSHLHRGRCYMSLGKKAEAVEAFGGCVALKPKLPWGYSSRGLALGLMGRYHEGETDLNRALTLETDFRPALLNRGILAQLQGKTQRALADFGKVLEPPAEKRLIEAAYYRGVLHAERRDFRKALADFDMVAAESPGFRFVYLLRAQVHFLQDDPRGVADLTRYLELGLPTRPDPQGPVLFALRGRQLRHLVSRWGLKPEQATAALKLARDQLNRAIQLGDRSAEVLDDLGSVLELLGEPAKAFDIYAQALAAGPPPDLKAKILSKRGWVFAQSPERSHQEKAREAFTALLRLEPHSADARAGLGYLAALRKSSTEAQREAVHALLDGAGDYLALHNLACIYAELSRTDKAQRKEHEDVAIALLVRAVELWRRGGLGPNEIELIRSDPSLASLLPRPELKKLLGQ
ncbi:MAG TPA: protein kinase [Gemmataceae bacterium]|nr:protein kinase [Gemmataceae bacterium]